MDLVRVHEPAASRAVCPNQGSSRRGPTPRSGCPKLQVRVPSGVPSPHVFFFAPPPPSCTLLGAAIAGAVIMPWMIFYQQSAVVERRLTVDDLKYSRIDTAVGVHSPVAAHSPPIMRRGWGGRGYWVDSEWTIDGHGWPQTNPSLPCLRG